jgi:DNA (cytosine-5)-methyltransferase 1
MTHLDLFSGIGGFALAAQWAGFQTIGFSEIDPYCSKILKQHWPDIKNYGDIRTADFTDVGDVDLLTGGFPCQPFSVAGKKKGREDDRHLWPEMLRVIAQVKPARIVGENVTGIIGMELDNVLSDLESIGYATWPIIVPACAVDAPHQRKRVWILADSGRKCSRPEKSGRNEERPSVQSIGCCQNVSNSEINKRRIFNRNSKANGCKWPVEPPICRVANGIPNRSHRLKGLGNSIVPQVAYQIIKAIPTDKP